MRNSIVKWLKSALTHVVQHSIASTSETVVAASLHQACSSIWHLTEVLHRLAKLYLYIYVTDSSVVSVCSQIDNWHNSSVRIGFSPDAQKYRATCPLMLIFDML